MTDYTGWFIISLMGTVGICLIILLFAIHIVAGFLGILWIGWILFWVVSAQMLIEYRVDLPDLIKRKMEGFTED